MNILFFSAHPAQVHSFNALRIELEAHGHQTFCMATQKDISKYLLDYYHIDYTLIEKPGGNFFSKARVLFLNTLKCMKFIRKNKVDLILSRVSPYKLHAFKRI